ncbi:hypothetical protein HPB47_018153 [Ixodes persulcatus]|uniref:Uncharacterized protein n=1 Tax=Ixodes persulcatus TaxID=34615 RepID=A0AC60QP14_IXOPE|nr:hypothetical protein HPB47_018153 [Ixodes persulcatus]
MSTLNVYVMLRHPVLHAHSKVLKRTVVAVDVTKTLDTGPTSGDMNLGLSGRDITGLLVAIGMGMGIYGACVHVWGAISHAGLGPLHM